MYRPKPFLQSSRCVFPMVLWFRKWIKCKKKKNLIYSRFLSYNFLLMIPPIKNKASNHYQTVSKDVYDPDQWAFFLWLSLKVVMNHIYYQVFPSLPPEVQMHKRRTAFPLDNTTVFLRAGCLKNSYLVSLALYTSFSN